MGPASATGAPSIAGVTLRGTVSAPSITVRGTNFGTIAGLGSPSSSCGTGSDYGNNFLFADSTDGWNAGEGTPDYDCIGVIVQSYSATKVVFGFGSQYGTYPIGSGVALLSSGDHFTMTLLGASFSGTAKYKTSSTPCTPSITSVGTFQAQASQSVEILGSCFGTGPALNASDTFNLMISDRSATVPWSACNLGVSDGITCSVSSWTNDEITFTGFNGVYGTVRHRLKAGDELIVRGLESANACRPDDLSDECRGHLLTPTPATVRPRHHVCWNLPGRCHSECRH